MYKLIRGNEVIAISESPITYDQNRQGYVIGNALYSDDGQLRVGEVTQTVPASYIDIGPFFDRFGAAKMAVLTSADATVKAIIQDVMARKWVDLDRPDVSQAIDIIMSKVAQVTADIKANVLKKPVADDENLALRKLYFS